MGRSFPRATASPRSVPSSPPRGPPPLIHARSPYARIPLPPTIPSNIILNPLLELGLVPSIQYNVTLPPPSMLLNSSGPRHHEGWFQLPATEPSMTSVTIRSSALDRPIVVRPANIYCGFVTVWDVLSAIHNAFREEALRLIHSPQPRDRCIWQQHPQLSFQLGADAEPVVRATMSVLLAGCCQWIGLTRSLTEDEVWIIHTG